MAGVIEQQQDLLARDLAPPPGRPERLDELGQARPYALWLRGRADLPSACLRSVSVMGSRAATGYGAHVAGEIAADLGERGWAVVSGGA